MNSGDGDAEIVQIEIDAATIYLLQRVAAELHMTPNDLAGPALAAGLTLWINALREETLS